MLRGEAKHWWREARDTLSIKEEFLIWEVFLQAFQKNYFPKSVHDEKELEFMELMKKNLSL